MEGIAHRSNSEYVKAVAIVEWNQRGHHETYLRHYTQGFLARGLPVIVLCKRAGDLTDWISKNTDRNTQNFIAIELPEHTHERSRKLKSKIVDWLKKRRLRQALKRGEAALGVKCNWIHLACFYEHQGLISQRLIQTFNLPWTSLYLHPNHFYSKPAKSKKAKKHSKAAKKLLHDTRLRGLLLLDESIAPKVQKHCNCPVIVAPDFTNASLPQTLDTPKKASSRQRIPTIGTLGHLLPSKGVILIAKLILQERLNNHSFILAGSLPLQKFNKHEQKILRDIQQSPSTRTYFERIKDEAAYNALMTECDVLLATYINFPHSSNTLTKAATFEIPIIVNDGHLMAQRVREYRLGEIVPEGDLEALRDAILKITTNTEHWCETNKPRWEEYRSRHSIEALSNSIQQLHR